MRAFYATLGTAHGGPGCVKVEAKNESEVRTLLKAHLQNRYCMIYDHWAKVHPLDQKLLGIISSKKVELTGKALLDFQESLRAKIAGPDHTKGNCIKCNQPFSEANVHTKAGWKETKISQICEDCFDNLFKDF